MEYIKEYWFLISSVIIPVGTYLIGKQHNKILRFKERDDAKKEALMTILQSNLTNTYFAYSTIKKIPDYIYQNWINELKVYEKLGGNNYIQGLAKKMEQFEIIHTDILR